MTTGKRKGVPRSEATKKKLSDLMKGKNNWSKGRKLTEEHKEKIRIGNIGKHYISTKWSLEAKERGRLRQKCGPEHHSWKIDRSELQRYGDDNLDRRSSAYRDWRLTVYKRDNFKCKINNQDCSGKIQAHHILSWKDYPELRYETNNGITLCHAHHPRRRAEEKRLIPVFSELVSVSNIII